MRKIRLGYTDIFLEDFEPGQGKITISSTQHGAFTYYWGAMGSNDLESFIQQTNAEYFCGKLSTNPHAFDSNLSVRNVRRFIREDLKDELPWYKFTEGQKAMREKLKEIEQECYDERQFVDYMQSFTDGLFTELPYEEEKEFFQILRDSIENEPWGFIANSESIQFKWLRTIHHDLKKFFQSENKKAS